MMDRQTDGWSDGWRQSQYPHHLLKKSGDNNIMTVKAVH